MQRLSSGLLGVFFLSSSLVAQAGPGLSVGFGTPGGKADKTFTATNLDKNKGLYTATSSSKDIAQIYFTKSGIPNLKAGQWAVTLTLGALNSTYGGDGDNDDGVAMGLFDRSVKPPTFTPNHMADKMNFLDKRAFGLMIEPEKGLYAVVDWADAMKISYRASNSANFPAPISFTTATGTPVVTGVYLDPAITKVGGQLVLFFLDKSNNTIVYRQVTPTISSGALTSAVLGNVVTVWTPTTGIPHSPSPIVDKNGTCQGLLVCADISADSDMYFKAGLKPKQPAIMFCDRSGWQNNGGITGGSILFAEGALTHQTVYACRGAWMVGSNPAINTIATITIGCHVPRNAATQVATTMVAVGLSTMKPVTIPGFFGQFGLGPNWLILGTAVAIDKDETAHFPIPIPNDNNLKGVEVVLQGLAAPPVGNPILTNNAFIRVQK